MTIKELLKRLRSSCEGIDLEIKLSRGHDDIEIKGIAYDSRSVSRDYLFVAIKGLSTDGHNYIKDAISRGATAVVTDAAVGNELITEIASHQRLTHVVTTHSRRALAHLAAAFYCEPCRGLNLIGITGTNGKTTTSYITKAILDEWGKDAGLIGTINYIIKDRIIKASHTTPESLELQRYLREMVDSGIEYSVLEVSSHALALDRIECCSFKVAVFTNFSQDHLDFHGSMEEYFNAKARLFTYLRDDGFAVMNYDDPMVRELSDRLDCKVITCGIHDGAMVKAENIRAEGLGKGLKFEILTPEDRYEIETQLYGRFNIYNILLSAGVAYGLGIDNETIKKGIRGIMPVPGRFEVIDEGQDFLAIVDYAHTEDALRNLIQEARGLTKGRVITVFGCGGNRDRAKRPLVGNVSSELSDIVIITSDNPRDEDPMDIIKDILKGVKGDNYIIQPDRAKAIGEAVTMANRGDVLLIAGKGHEDYQEIRGIRINFDDRVVLRRALRQRMKGL